MPDRPGRTRPDQLSTYAAKRRKFSLTERAILSDGFGEASHERTLSIPELADRLDLSAHALAPHLHALIAKGELITTPHNGAFGYRRVA